MHFANTVIPGRLEIVAHPSPTITVARADLYRAIRHLPRFEAIVFIRAVFQFSGRQARKRFQELNEAIEKERGN